MLTSNVLRSMLPRQLQDHVLTEEALLRAVGKVSASFTSSANDVLGALERLDGDPELCRHAGYLADFLTEAARTAHGLLTFPPGIPARLQPGGRAIADRVQPARPRAAPRVHHIQRGPRRTPQHDQRLGNGRAAGEDLGRQPVAEGLHAATLRYYAERESEGRRRRSSKGACLSLRDGARGPPLI